MVFLIHRSARILQCGVRMGKDTAIKHTRSFLAACDFEARRIAETGILPPNISRQRNQPIRLSKMENENEIVVCDYPIDPEQLPFIQSILPNYRNLATSDRLANRRTPK